jgi:hypothetical protein
MKTLFSFLLILAAGFSAIAQKTTIEVNKTLSSPVIDGVEEEVWDDVLPIYLEYNFEMEEATVTAYWKALWCDTSIFILVNVLDNDHYPSWESGGNAWEYDQIELYFDVNSNLNDGKGPSEAGSGHYQSAPGFEKSGYGVLHEKAGTYWEPACQYEYRTTDQNYVYEWSFPSEAFSDKYGQPMTIQDLAVLPEGMGFDVTVDDQDEDITTFRQRKVWQSGDGEEQDAWNDMDACGAIKFVNTNPFPTLNDTVLCDSTQTTVISFEVVSDSVISFEWKTDGGEILYSDVKYCKVKWNASGEKNVKEVLSMNSDQTDTFKRKVIVNPKMSVYLGDDITICKGLDFSIVPDIINGRRPFRYFWNNISGDSIFYGSTSKNTTEKLEVTDEAGCSASDSKTVIVPGKPNPGSICMITVDAETNKNMVIIEENTDAKIGAYQILKESSIAGSYVQVGSIVAGNEPTFIDTTSKPSRNADRYTIITIDTCNQLSVPSDPHQTIHLQISQGLPGNYNLSWSPYIGFAYNTYYIYKGKSVENMELIDELASSKTQYTDTSSALAYYQVTVKKNAPCLISDQKSSGTSYDEAGSNIVNTVPSNIITAKDQKVINVYPNPFKDIINFELNIEKPQTVTVAVFNVMGEKIFECNTDPGEEGIFKYTISETDLSDVSGIGILRIDTEDQIYFCKIIKQ